MTIRSAAVLFACLTVASSAGAQGLPSEPIAFAGGRVTVAGDVSASFGSDDPGFFNYTDYEYSALQNFRFGVSAEIRASQRVQVLAELRLDQGDVFEPYGLYVRIKPLASRQFFIKLSYLFRKSFGG